MQFCTIPVEFQDIFLSRSGDTAKIYVLENIDGLELFRCRYIFFVYQFFLKRFIYVWYWFREYLTAAIELLELAEVICPLLAIFLLPSP